LIFSVLLLGGCAQSPGEPPLPPLCPATTDAQDVSRMAAILHGRKESVVVAHYGQPAQRSRDTEAVMDILVWGPQRIAYRRADGKTVPHDCRVAMYADNGTITRAVWQLTPPE
jgi:hypothetical protein